MIFYCGVQKHLFTLGHTESPPTVASIQIEPETNPLGEEKPSKTVETSRIVPVQREIAEGHTSAIKITGLHETDSVGHLIGEFENI